MTCILILAGIILALGWLVGRVAREAERKAREKAERRYGVRATEGAK